MEDIKVVVCGIGKMENHYIREWVEHYQKIGFDNVILIDNNDEDGERYEDVIGDYIENGFVILEDYRGVYRAQIQAYDDMYHKYSSDYDWIMYVDIDEFLQFGDQKMDIKTFVSQDKFKDFGNIRFNWKVYTDSGLLKVEDDNYSITRFTEVLRKSNPYNKQTKAIMRTKVEDLKIESSHGYTKGNLVETCNAKGKKCKNEITNVTGDPLWEDAWINHYMLKTMEEYVTNKMVRKWPTWYKDGGKEALNLGYFFTINKRSKEKVEYGKMLIKKNESNADDTK